MSHKFFLSIVIPCRNEHATIRHCIESVFSQQGLADIDFEVLVIDGMSDDGTREILKDLKKTYPQLSIIDNPKKIVPTALNIGITQSRGSIIMRMDAHNIYAQDYIKKCLETHDRTQAANVGGPWIAQGKGKISEVIAAAYSSGFASGGGKVHRAHYEGAVDTVCFGCFRRDIFEQVGLFDEELVRNQDDEFNLRLCRAGLTVWQSPDIRSIYIPRNSFKSLWKQYQQYGYWKVRVIQKHKIPASIRHIIPGTFCLLLCLLPLLAFLWRSLWWLWFAMVSCYLLLNITISGLTAIRTQKHYFAYLPFAFACFHLAYGFGFIRGLLDFILLRTGPASYYYELSRNHTPRYAKNKAKPLKNN